jgi:tetratricopeptide (TPR) repeat protein
MDVDPWFWAYAALYKLATIGAGVVAISFGFRLFKLRVRASGNATVTLGDYQLQSNTTAPGTFFALFGASIIGIMIYQGTPSYEQTSEAVRVTKGPEPIAPAAGRPDRVETQVGFLAAYQRGVELRKEGDDKAALKALSEALAVKDATLEQAAGPLREVAEIYLEQRRSAEALPLARIAAGLQGEDPASLNTLAQVLLDRSEADEALEVVKRGLEISNRNAELLHTQALISEANGDVTQAIAIMEQAVVQDSRFEGELKTLKSRHE